MNKESVVLYSRSINANGDAARRSQLGEPAGYRARFVFICVYNKWMYVCMCVCVCACCRIQYSSPVEGHCCSCLQLDTVSLPLSIAVFLSFVCAHTNTHFNLLSPYEWTVNRDWGGCCLLPWEQQMCSFRPHAGDTHTLTRAHNHTWQCVH